jgi:polysaccharide export outer membrane protein
MRMVSRAIGSVALLLSCAAWAQSPAAGSTVTVTVPPASSLIQGAGSAETGPQHKAAGASLVGPQAYYTLEPGDTVTVNFRFTPEFNDEVVVGPDGRATLKSAGDVMLSGLTIPEAQRMIVRDSSAKLVNPEVTVSLKDFQRPQVVVAGEVTNPGHFELKRPMTATQAILMAGGPKDDAQLGKVLLFRRINSEYAEVHVLQLGRYDARTRARNDMILQPDDLLLIRHDLVSRIDRYVKLVNLGVYLNPIGNNGIF